jgi:hypothetical protein
VILWAIDYAIVSTQIVSTCSTGRDKMRELCFPETQFIQKLALIASSRRVLSSPLHIHGNNSYKPTLQSLLQPCRWRDMAHTRLLYHVSSHVCSVRITNANVLVPTKCQYLWYFLETLKKKLMSMRSVWFSKLLDNLHFK